MAKEYRVLKGNEKDIEKEINLAAAEGWEVESFGYTSIGRAAYWALIAKEKKEENSFSFRKKALVEHLALKRN